MMHNQVIKTFGGIFCELVNAMGMHAANMQRQSRGEAIAYSEERFEDIVKYHIEK